MMLDCNQYVYSMHSIQAQEIITFSAVLLKLHFFGSITQNYPGTEFYVFLTLNKTICSQLCSHPSHGGPSPSLTTLAPLLLIPKGKEVLVFSTDNDPFTALWNTKRYGTQFAIESCTKKPPPMHHRKMLPWSKLLALLTTVQHPSPMKNSHNVQMSLPNIYAMPNDGNTINNISNPNFSILVDLTAPQCESINLLPFDWLLAWEQALPSQTPHAEHLASPCKPQNSITTSQDDGTPQQQVCPLIWQFLILKWQCKIELIFKLCCHCHHLLISSLQHHQQYDPVLPTIITLIVWALVSPVWWHWLNCQ